MLSGGADPPRPPSNDSNGKGTTAKKRRYMIRLLPPRDSLTSLIPSPSSVSILVRPPYVLHLHHHYLRLKLDHLYVMLMHVDHLRLHTHLDGILMTSYNSCLSPVSSSTTLTFYGLSRLLLLNPYLCSPPFMSCFITTLAKSPIFSTVESHVLFSNGTL